MSASTTTEEMRAELTPVRCVDCWVERELVRTAAYVYDGRSCCSRHLMVRMEADTVEA